jgi:hypothetical protein
MASETTYSDPKTGRSSFRMRQSSVVSIATGEQASSWFACPRQRDLGTTRSRCVTRPRGMYHLKFNGTIQCRVIVDYDSRNRVRETRCRAE